MAEDKSNFGKIVKRAIREMWALEYEVDELQHKFADSIGTMDLDNLDVDFIEDMMLKAKPLQTVLKLNQSLSPNPPLLPQQLPPQKPPKPKLLKLT